MEDDVTDEEEGVDEEKALVGNVKHGKATSTEKYNAAFILFRLFFMPRHRIRENMRTTSSGECVCRLFLLLSRFWCVVKERQNNERTQILATHSLSCT